MISVWSRDICVYERILLRLVRFSGAVINELINGSVIIIGSSLSLAKFVRQDQLLDLFITVLEYLKDERWVEQ